MSYRLSLVTAPTLEPLLLREVKDWLLGPEHDDHSLDGKLFLCMQAAREYLEGKYGLTGLLLSSQTWDLILDRFPASDQIRIPLYPLQEVSSLKYMDSDGVEATWAASNYTVDTDSEPGRIVLTYGNSWPSVTLAPMNPIKIRFVGGYDPAGNLIPSSPQGTARRKRLPHLLKIAMLMLVGHYFENPEATVNEAGAVSKSIALGVDWAIANYCRPECYAV